MRNYFIFLLTLVVLFVGCSEKPLQVSETSSEMTTILTPTSIPPQPTPSPLVRFALENNISENLAYKLENYLGENLSENAVKLIKILSKFNSDYIPKNISDIVPESYKSELSERLQENIVNYITSDGNVSKEEIKALEFILTLPKDVQKWYIEEVGLNEETVKYLNLLNEIEDEDFKLYAAKNVLCYADRQIDNIEKEFLKNPDKNLDVIKKYYSSKLEKIPNLREQVEELPKYKENSIKTIEALEDIAALAKNAEPYEIFEDRFDPDKVTPDREVYEAFELMVNGGTPDPKDFGYSVPDYNTELECLWWLAEQNEFKNYDTLAQAIAMTHGIWVTMGDKDVKEAVKKDINDFLRFGRETAEMQDALNLNYNLEKYPLEAKVAWAWRGGTILGSRMPLIWTIVEPQDPKNYTHRSYIDQNKKLDLFGYHWNAIKVSTLEEMRHATINKNWLDKNVGNQIYNLECYFYLCPSVPTNQHHFRGHAFNFQNYRIVTVNVWGVDVPDYNIGNNNWQFELFKKTRAFQGECTDEASLIDSWAKSFGIAVDVIWRGVFIQGKQIAGHFIPTYYDPLSNSWKATTEQLQAGKEEAGNNKLCLQIFKPAIDQTTYFKKNPQHAEKWPCRGTTRCGLPSTIYYTHPKRYLLDEIKEMYDSGVHSTQFKKWVFYQTS